MEISNHHIAAFIILVSIQVINSEGNLVTHPSSKQEVGTPIGSPDPSPPLVDEGLNDDHSSKADVVLSRKKRQYYYDPYYYGRRRLYPNPLPVFLGIGGGIAPYGGRGIGGRGFGGRGFGGRGFGGRGFGGRGIGGRGIGGRGGGIGGHGGIGGGHGGGRG